MMMLMLLMMLYVHVNDNDVGYVVVVVVAMALMTPVHAATDSAQRTSKPRVKTVRWAKVSAGVSPWVPMTARGSRHTAVNDCATPPHFHVDTRAWDLTNRFMISGC